MSGAPDLQPACGFCEGTGVWPDPDEGPASTDPCPLCAGTGLAQACRPDGSPGDALPAAEPVDMDRLLALLPRLSQADRQRLYEALYRQYDCRIYRG